MEIAIRSDWDCDAINIRFDTIKSRIFHSHQICFEWIACFRLHPNNVFLCMAKFNRCVVLCDFISQTKCHIQYHRNNVSIVFIQSVWLDRFLGESGSSSRRSSTTTTQVLFASCQRISHSIYATNCQWPKKGTLFHSRRNRFGKCQINVKIYLLWFYLIRFYLRKAFGRDNDDRSIVRYASATKARAFDWTHVAILMENKSSPIINVSIKNYFLSFRFFLPFVLAHSLSPSLWALSHAIPNSRYYLSDIIIATFKSLLRVLMGRPTLLMACSTADDIDYNAIRENIIISGHEKHIITFL